MSTEKKKNSSYWKMWLPGLQPSPPTARRD